MGYNAVAPHSEGLADWKEKIPGLQRRFGRLILNYDNDAPGHRAVLEVQKEFPLESIVFQEKDLSDTIKKVSLEETQKLIDRLL
jgi:DNA primase